MKYCLGILVYLISFLMPNFSSGQCKEWKWPADSSKAKEKFALFQDAARSKQYKQALPTLNWLLMKAPDLNVSIYVRGAEVMDALAMQEKKPELRKSYVDSLMLIYDLRMQHCQDSTNVMNRKAFAFYKFNINGPEPEKLMILMDQVICDSGADMMDGLIVPYMETMVVNQLKLKKFSQEDILFRYERLVGVIDQKKSLTKDEKAKAKLNGYRSQIDELLLKIVKVDCEFVKANLAPKYKQNPNDIVLAKKIFNYLLEGKCIKEPLWLETGEFIFSKENDYGLAKNLGLQFLLQENVEKSKFYFEVSLKLAPTASDSAEVFVYLGSMSAKAGDNVKARDQFRLAIKAAPQHLEAFERIGDLYYAAFMDCAKKINMADDRFVFLGAYDYYQRAGRKEKMELAKNSFPSVEEIFLMNYKSGQTVHMGCWIDESTILRTRD